jgi:hypothetical protein
MNREKDRARVRERERKIGVRVDIEIEVGKIENPTDDEGWNDDGNENGNFLI